MPTPTMSVSDAVAGRHSTRAFLNTPVAATLLRDILAKAQRAPSGGNLQPWVVHVLAGAELQRFKDLIATRRTENPQGEGPEYAIYPTPLVEPYKARRGQCAEDMYATLGLARDNKPARLEFVSGNFDFWGAPAALFVCIDRRLGATQWVDLGLYLQTFMLLCTEAGLATCAQEFWTLWHKSVAEFLQLPDELMPFCGVAVGHADPQHPVNGLRTARAELSENIHFHGL